MIRSYQPGDEIDVSRIFQQAIYQLVKADYTPAQLDAWAGPKIDVDGWKRRCENKRPFVYEIDGRVAGFIELGPDGHIDCVYVDPEFARRGVMSELMAAVKAVAVEQALPKLFAEVSITARPFFERHGFRWLRANQVEGRGVAFDNFMMECQLDDESSEAPAGEAASS